MDPPQSLCGIHPFRMANGRTSRLIMNHLAFSKRISCRQRNRGTDWIYFIALGSLCGWRAILVPFARMVADLATSAGPLPRHDGAFAGYTAESNDVCTVEEQSGMTPDAESVQRFFAPKIMEERER